MKLSLGVFAMALLITCGAQAQTNITQFDKMARPGSGATREQLLSAYRDIQSPFQAMAAKSALQQYRGVTLEELRAGKALPSGRIVAVKAVTITPAPAKPMPMIPRIGMAERPRITLVRGAVWTPEMQKESRPVISEKARAVLSQEDKARLENPYTILRVPVGASQEDIAKAYKKWATQFHPDRNKEPYAADAFAIVTWAYNELKPRMEMEK